MLFDLQGKRKRLIQVIYALLALLMGGGLVFLGIGGEVSGGLLDAFTNRQGVAAGELTKEADRLQERADENPTNEQVLTRLVRARYTAGNSLYELDEAGQPTITPEARSQFEAAADTWHDYLELNPDPPDPNVAQLVANALFALAQGATDGVQARNNSAAAAEAQAIFAESRPSVGSFSTLALYSFFGNDFEEGDAAVARVMELSRSPQAKRRNKREMADYRKQAKEFQEQLKAYEQATQAGTEGDAPPQILSPGGGLSGAGP